MCGIIGYVGPKPVLGVLMDGLQRLEYRGYDSAGVAITANGGISVRRARGKLSCLTPQLVDLPGESHCGVGHTRWATHGAPSEDNAHPHRDCTGRVVVVHNGIIENYVELRRRLLEEGHAFRSETDSEVIAHLVERETRGDGLEHAVRRALAGVRGLFAVVLISADEPETIVAVRNGPPIVVGLGAGEFIVASDLPAILHHTRDVVFLGDREMAVVTRERVRFTDLSGADVSTVTQRVAWDPVRAEKGGYTHFMQKEIFEQPRAVRETLAGRVRVETGEVLLEELGLDAGELRGIDRVVILACGTSWHAGLVGKAYIERLAGLPVEVDYASEYRYRAPLAGPRTLAVAVTQSGETADTLGALREARGLGASGVAICNVVGSQVTRECDGTVYTHAGPEIGVASTKAFTTQLVALQLLALFLGQARGTLRREEIRWHLESLMALPRLLERALACEPILERIAAEVYRQPDFLYLGRGLNYPIALEGALKLKEIPYIHAEGYPAGEMKHGPIALIDEGTPVVALAPRDAVFEKMLGNVQEVKARGGVVVALTSEGDDRIDAVVTTGRDFVVRVPPSQDLRHARADGRAAPVAGLPCGRPPGLRRGSASQPGEERDRGVSGPGRPVQPRTAAGCGGLRSSASSAGRSARTGMARQPWNGTWHWCLRRKLRNRL